MLTHLEKQTFIIGKFNQVIDALLQNLQEKSTSKIILPCSLNDLALQTDNKHKQFYKNIDFCTNDSMLITFFLRHKHKTLIDRVYGPDLMKAVLAKTSKNQIKLKHYFLAPNKDSMQKLAAYFDKNYPQMNYKLNFLPSNITKEEEIVYLKKTLISQVNFIWIGIGSPKQITLAYWLKTHSSGINIMCVGAAFAFISGHKKQAPNWIRKSGLEWLFRLISEPKRLWKRYLIAIPKYLISLILRCAFRL
jgi:N-acetylglucosaminyldiphosphoundecaprenol N-acetyl-beta-D-mannosaminyltransferase